MFPSLPYNEIPTLSASDFPPCLSKLTFDVEYEIAVPSIRFFPNCLSIPACPPYTLVFPSPNPSCLSFPFAPIPVTHTPAFSPTFSRVPNITSLFERSLFTVCECWNVSACADAYICPDRLSSIAVLVGSDIACT